MLTPEYLRNAPQSLVQLFQQLEDFIIADIARRIVQSEGQVVTSTAEWQAWVAENIGLSIDAIQAKIAEITGKSEVEINALFDDAARRALEYDNKIIGEASGGPDTIDNNPAMVQLVESMKTRTNGELRNLTRSMGFAVKVSGQIVFKPIAKFYQDTLDFAHIQVRTGATDYISAIRQAVRTLTNSGLRTVDYATGWINRVDVAVRRAVLSGVKDESRQLSKFRADDLGTTIYEISAHSGARPTHKVWQGKRYDTTGKYYPTEDELTHGELNDYGCRHDVYPVPSKDFPYAYTNKELENIDPPPFNFEGKEYTHYEATQQQRKIERAVRKSKETLIGIQAAMEEAQGSLREDLQKDFENWSIKLQRQNQLYVKFSAAAGLKEQNERRYFQGFGRSISAKARAAAKRAAK